MLNFFPSLLEIRNPGLRPSKRSCFWAVIENMSNMKTAIKGLRIINYEERSKDTAYKKRLNKVMNGKAS
jgi:hypothetical protein